MPLYEYECESCHRRFERIQKFSDPPASECPHCGGPVRKLLSSPAIQFKGTGWYITDYARQGEKSDKAEKAADKPAATESKPAEAPAASSQSTKDAAPAASETAVKPKPASNTNPSGN